MGPDSDIFHSGEYLFKASATEGRHVLVVGGGQSGAEVFLDLITRDQDAPASVSWVSSRPGLLPLDDSPFSNEWFTPPYVEYFQRLDHDKRRELLSAQRMASDGISLATLDRIYRRLYHIDYLESGVPAYRILAGTRFVGLKADSPGYLAEMEFGDLSRRLQLRVDMVVLATGYVDQVPACLGPLRERLVWEAGKLVSDNDYAVAWDGPDDQHIYLQNGARHSHGIADPNLSLTSWRSAKILNRIAGRQLFKLGQEKIALDLIEKVADVASLENAMNEL